MVAGKRINSRRIYQAGAIVSALVVFEGFSRSYFLRPLFRTAPLPMLLHVHGAVMTLWFLLFALQIALVTSGRVLLHRRVGIVGMALAATLTVLAVLITIYAAKQPGELRPPTPFLGLVLISFIPFPILVGAGIHFRFRPEVHRRLMLLATLSILGAALVRFPLAFSETGAGIFMLAGTDALILGFVLIDTLKHGRLHPAFVMGSAGVFLFQALSVALAPSVAWASALSWLVARVPGSL